MSTNESNPAAKPKTKLRRWQFGLRELFIAVVALSVWCAVASWSLYSAIFLLVWFVVVIGVILHCREERIRISWQMAALWIVLPLIFLSFLLSAMTGSPVHSSPASVELTLLNASDQTPISGAQIEFWPNGDFNDKAFAISNADGKAKITANFTASTHRGGWGRASTTIYLSRTRIQVSASGYQSREYEWEELSEDAFRSADALPGEPIVIELRPSPTAKNATHP